MTTLPLSQKHELALSTPGYYSQEVTRVFSKIECHLETAHPSVWHYEATKDLILQKAADLDGLSTDTKAKSKLYGLTFGAKDLFCIKDTFTTAGSRILKDFKAPYTATVITQLDQAGALFAGKTSMDEFAMGSFTDTSFLGKTSIPGFDDYTAGGSSGGSAASVAAQLFDFSVGSDTGGSIRQPAAFCGLVGYKPSYGAFSRYGMIAYSSSLDQAGLITKTVQDLKYVIDSIDTSKDLHDPTHQGFSKHASPKKMDDLVVGIFPEFITSPGVSDSVKAAYQSSLDKLAAAGTKMKPVDVPLMQHGAEIYYMIACAEASSNLARYQGVFFGDRLTDFAESHVAAGPDYWTTVAQYRSHLFGKEVQKRIMLGSYVLASENFDAVYKKAIALRGVLTQQLSEVLDTVDLLCLPTFPTTAPRWDAIAKMSTSEIYLADFMTVSFSLGGFPVVTIPTTRVFDLATTTGMQLVGKKLCDYQLITDSLTIEQHLLGAL